MIFNLVSNLDENFKIEKFNAYNHVIAYNLREELLKQGHEVNLVKDHSNKTPPKCDHVIVTSNTAMNRIRMDPSFLRLHKASASGKFCLWYDSDMGNWQMFDHIFVVNYRREKPSDLFKYVGWAADPTIFLPQQTEKIAFVDSYMWGCYSGNHDHVYITIRRVLKDLKIKTIQLVPEYNKGRASWLEMIEAFKQCSFNILTQREYWGLTNIESATCGALLVAHKDLDLPITWPSKLNHVLWETPEDLKAILSSSVDVEANRRLALKNSWKKIVNRIMENLN